MAWSLPGAALPEASARLPTQLKCPHPAQVSSPGGRPQGEQLMSAFPSRQPRRDVLLGGSRELKSSRNPNTSGRASVTPYEAPTHRLMERGDTFGAFSQQNHPPPRTPQRPPLLSELSSQCPFFGVGFTTPWLLGSSFAPLSKNSPLASCTWEIVCPLCCAPSPWRLCARLPPITVSRHKW